MLVTNDCLKESIFVTSHAAWRWRERGEGDLADSLRQAVPFGVQYGESLLLIHGDAVFATKKRDATRRVITCLTKAFAIANMQTLGFRFDTAEQPKPKSFNIDVSDWTVAQNLVAQIGGLGARDDDELISIRESASRLRDAIKGPGRKDLKRNLGILMQVAQRELGSRSRIASAQRHGFNQDRNIAALKQAMREILPHETYVQICERSEEILVLLGDRVAKAGWHEALKSVDGQLADATGQSDLTG